MQKNAIHNFYSECQIHVAISPLSHACSLLIIHAHTHSHTDFFSTTRALAGSVVIHKKQEQKDALLVLQIVILINLTLVYGGGGTQLFNKKVSLLLAIM